MDRFHGLLLGQRVLISGAEEEARKGAGLPEFKDYEELEGWLKGRSQEDCIAIAARAALRSLPELGTLGPETFGGTALPVQRALLTSCARRVYATPEVRDAILSATRSADTVDLSTHSTVLSAASSATRSAALCAHSAATLSAHSAALSTAVVSARSTTEKDCKGLQAGVDIFQLCLWSDGRVPEFLVRAFEKLSDHWEREPEVWGFWKRWYQGHLDGKPLDWELQKAVALIPDADWAQGAAHIAEKIREIEAEFLAKKLPQAETIEQDPETGLFFSVPRDPKNPPLLAATLSQVEDALSDCLENPSNGLNEAGREARVLRRTIAKYGNDPQRVEMDLTSVHAGLIRQIACDDLLKKTLRFKGHWKKARAQYEPLTLRFLRTVERLMVRPWPSFPRLTRRCWLMRSLYLRPFPTRI